MDVVKKLIRFMKPWWGLVIVALALSLGSSVLSVVTPTLLSGITGEIQSGLAGVIDMAAIERLALIFVGLLALSFVFSVIQNRTMAKVTNRSSQKMRKDLNQKIDRMPLNYFDTHSFGDMLSRMTNDVDTVSSALDNSISSLFSNAVTLIGCVIAMFATNWMMASAGIVASLLGFLAAIAIMKKSQPYFIAQQTELGALNGQIEEVFSGHMVVHAFNGEHEAKADFHESNRSLQQNAWKSQFLSGLMQPVMGLVGNLGYVVVCIVGALLVMNGIIGMGTIVAFMMYIRLFTNPLSSLAQAMGSLQTAMAAGGRVFELLDAEELADESTKRVELVGADGNVRFDHVKFGYDPERIIVNDFSADIKAGQKVAIVGPTGAGKTTIINLLMRFYEMGGGSIQIDGISTNTITRENVSELFSMVLQDTWLFEGTIRENIAYNKQDVTDAEMEAVCRASGLNHWIRTLPDGLDTLLAEQSALSQGQKQLVTIARAMIEDRPLLILDEATSSVDTRTEKLIQRALDTLTEGRTSFVIAHRLSTIKNADVIFVMKDGDIIETGNHEELLADGGFYAGLYNSQFEQAA